jgi:polygalacturonase
MHTTINRRNILRLLSFGAGAALAPKRETYGANVFNIRDFGATGDPAQKCTTILQQALDKCHTSGGGMLTLPAGTYTTGTIYLRNRVNLHLEAGAVLKASGQQSDYPKLYKKRYGNDRAVIAAHNCTDITISGEGVIDGNAPAFMDFTTEHDSKGYDPRRVRQGFDYRAKFPDGPGKPLRGEGNMEIRYKCLFLLSECQNVRFENFTLRDSARRAVRFHRCDGVTVQGMRIRNHQSVPNSDGIHCTMSRNVNIADCDFICGDDAITLTGMDGMPGDWTEDITVTNCVLQSRSSAIRVGYESGGVRRCTFRNITIQNSNRGIGVYSRKEGGVRDVEFSDITIETRLHSGWWGTGEPIHISAVPKNKRLAPGVIENVRFQNIQAVGETGIIIYGSDFQRIRNVTFEDMHLRMRNSPLQKSFGGNFDLQQHTQRNLCVFQHDIPGLYARGFDGLTLRNFTLEWGNSMPQFCSHGLEIEEFWNFTVDGFHGRQAHVGDSRAAIVLRSGREVSIRNSRAAQGAGTFVKLDNVVDAGEFANNDLRQAKRAGDVEQFAMSENRMP